MLRVTYEINLRRTLRLTAIVLILSSMISAMCVCCREWLQAPMQLHLWVLLISLALYTLYYILNAFAWTLVLKLFGHPIRVATGIQLWIRCEAFRWLPGSIWNFGARAAESTRLAVPSTVAVKSMISELAFSITARLVIIAAACAVYRQAVVGCLKQLSIGGMVITAVALGGSVLALALWGRRQRKTLRQATSIKQIGRPCSSPIARVCEFFAVIGYYVSICALQGIALKVLISGLGAGDNVPTLALIAVNAAAWLVGFVAVFAPGGIVVREAVLAVALSNWLSPADGIAVAVAWRILQIAVESMLLLFVLVHSRSMTLFAPSPLRRTSPTYHE